MEVKEFVHGMFAQYYSRHSAEIEAPRESGEREFGFLLFKEDIMVRHKGFRSPEDLRKFIKLMAPSDVYYSAAYYDKPEESMELKGWKGADLIFDVDADHIETSCKNIHDSWTCLDCGLKGRGEAPDSCANCGSQRLKEEGWLCDKCLEAAKTEILKLIDMLTNDFGFSHSEISVFFTGHRGYHVHVESEKVRTLDQQARKEIADFVQGTGLDVASHGLEERSIGAGKGGKVVVGPNLYDAGWRGRLARGSRRLMMSLTDDFLKSLELRYKTINLLLKQKDVLASTWSKEAAWGVLPVIGIGFWRKIAERAVKEEAVKIDSVVTTDIHRLIRLPNTLHGKTGLKAVKAPTVGLESFDPLSKSVAFKEGALKVYIPHSLEFRLGDVVYGPYEETIVELPTAAVIYLLLKGAAKLA